MDDQSQSRSVISASTRNSDSATLPRSSITCCEIPISRVASSTLRMHGGDEHRADVGRQRHPDTGERAIHPGADRAATHIATRMTTSVFRSAYASLSSPAGAWAACVRASAPRRCSGRLRPGCEQARPSGVRKPAPADQQRADRPADETARDDADHRRRQRQRTRPQARRPPRIAAQTPGPWPDRPSA